MATGRKITLKNDDNEWLIPKTIASNVVAIISKDDEGNTSFVYQDSVNSTLAQAKMDKGETGKDANGKPIYFNKTGKDLDDSIQKVIDGDTPVAKADVAQYLYYDNPDEDKEDKIDYEGLMGKVDTKATEAISKVTDEIYETVDKKITNIKTDVAALAKTQKDSEGRVRLATESDMLNEQIVDDEGYYGNEPNAVAVTPYILKRYLFGGEHINGVAGAANGVASLDEYGKLPSSQMPDGIDAIVECNTYDDFPSRGEGGKIYVDLSTGKSYRWGGTTYVEISKSLALGETTGTAYEGSKGKANADAIADIKKNYALNSRLNEEVERIDTKIDNIEIDTRNLISNGEILTKGVGETDNYNYIIIPIPIGAKVGDTFTFNCSKIENIQGSPTGYDVLLYDIVNRNETTPMVSITAENRAVTMTSIADVEEGNLVILLYIGKRGSTAGNEVRFYDCTLVKGNKPMLMWQPALEDEVAWRKIVGLNYVVTGDPIEY